MSFEMKNGENRSFTTTELLDLSDYLRATPRLGIFVDDKTDVEVISMFQRAKEGNVLIWALGDDLYVAQYHGSVKMYWSNSFKDVLDFAAEALYMA